MEMTTTNFKMVKKMRCDRAMTNVVNLTRRRRRRRMKGRKMKGWKTRNLLKGGGKWVFEPDPLWKDWKGWSGMNTWRHRSRGQELHNFVSTSR
jgi:hypothetical protein